MHKFVEIDSVIINVAHIVYIESKHDDEVEVRMSDGTTWTFYLDINTFKSRICDVLRAV